MVNYWRKVKVARFNLVLLNHTSRVISKKYCTSGFFYLFSTICVAYVETTLSDKKKSSAQIRNKFLIISFNLFSSYKNLRYALKYCLQFKVNELNRV